MVFTDGPNILCLPLPIHFDSDSPDDSFSRLTLGWPCDLLWAIGWQQIWFKGTNKRLRFLLEPCHHHGRRLGHSRDDKRPQGVQQRHLTSAWGHPGTDNPEAPTSWHWTWHSWLAGSWEIIKWHLKVVGFTSVTSWSQKCCQCDNRGWE